MTITLGASIPTVMEIEAVARKFATVEVTSEIMSRLAKAREVLDLVAASGQQIYGFNTGLGANLGTKIEGDATEFQIRFLRGRAIAVGDALPSETVRAAMFARVAGLAAGGTGISPSVFLSLLDCLNARVHPVMRRWGSIGASDLGLMAAVGLCLIGEGEAEFGGRIMPALDALHAAGLGPVILGSKDGVALISASSVSIGQGALVIADAQLLLEHQAAAAALTMEALGGNPAILDPRIQAARPAPGQVSAAASLRDLLEGSSLYDAGASVPLQDPLSLRCIASIQGATDHAISWGREMVELELRSAADNPLVLIDDSEVLSTGNFHGPALALSFETLGLAIAQSAVAAAGRFTHLTGAGRNGLPRYLSPRGAASAGFVPLQKTMAALIAAIRHAAQPVMLNVMPVSEGVEDQATEAPLAVAKCAGMLELWRHVIALEMMAAAQAVDLRAPLRIGRGTAMIRETIRSIVPFLDEDRPLGPDAEHLSKRLQDGPMTIAPPHH